MASRQANAVTEFMRTEMVKSLNPQAHGEEPRPYLDTDLFARKLELLLRRSRKGRGILDQKLGQDLPGPLAKAVSEQSGKKPQELTVIDILRIKNLDLARRTGMKAAEIAGIKRKAMGVSKKKNEQAARRSGRKKSK